MPTGHKASYRLSGTTIIARTDRTSYPVHASDYFLAVVRDSGKLIEVPVNEDDLLALMRDASLALTRMKAVRAAQEKQK